MSQELSHLSELQKAELDVLRVVSEICKERGLTYYLTGGSLLGAVRHHGFIPWDDDIDILMPRPDYETLKAHAKEYLPEQLLLSTYDTPGHIWSPKIIDTSTKFYLNNALLKKEIGAWVDILVLDGVPAPGLKRRFFKYVYLFARMLYNFSTFSQSVNLHRKRSLLDRILIGFARYSHIEKILSSKLTGNFYDRVCGHYSLDESEWAGALGGVMRFREIVPKNWFGSGVIMDFENIKVNCVTEWDKYLTYIYGDYMTPPPMSDRNKHNVTKL